MSSQANRVIGKDVIDSVDRTVGRVIGVMNNAEGDASQIGIEFLDGEFSTHATSQIIVVGDKVFIKYEGESDSETLIRDFKSIQQKINALDKLYHDNEIQDDIYTDIRGKYEFAFAEVLDKQKSLIGVLTDKLKALAKEAYSLRVFLAQTKVEHLTGDIDEQVYKVSDFALQARLNRVLSERGKLTEIANGILSAFEKQKPAVEQLAPSSESKSAIPLKLRDTVVQPAED